VSIKQLLQRPGVYHLYAHDDLVYVGKAEKAVCTSTGHRRLAA
jgi:excinuclease UvrABC nuclease subunit